MAYQPRNPNGQATMANSEPVVIASDQSAVPVSASSLPLPTGAATSAKQDTIIGHVDGIEGLLTTIDADTGSIDSKTPALGQALAAASVPVVLPAAQITTLTPPAAITGFLTESDFDTKVGSLTETAPATDTASSGLNGRLQRIAQRITSLIALIPTSLGQKTKANSFAVTLASDQDALPITDNAGSLTVDAPVGTPVFVRLSDGAAAIATLPVSLASLPALPTGTNNIGDVDVLTINGVAPAFGTGVRGATVQRVTIATDDIVPASQSGTWTVQPGNTANTTPWLITDTPATTGGLSTFHLVGAATNNATNVKASAGQVYSITAFNLSASPRYLKFHNTAGTPTAGSGVVRTVLIPGNTAGAGAVINIDKGLAFSTGIGISIVTGIADSDTTAIGASEVVVDIGYK